VQKKDEKDSKIFNIRPVCFWAFFVAITVALCSLNIWFALAFVSVILCLGFACQFLRAKDSVLSFLGSSRVFFVGTFVLCVLVMFSFSITTLVYSNVKTYGGEHNLTGVVESYKLQTDADGTSFMTLSGAKFDDANVSGHVIVFISKYDEQGEIAVGEYVKLLAKLSPAKVNDININSQVMYSSSVNWSDISVDGKSYGLKFVVWRYSKSFLEKFMPPTSANLMYSMMFGDRSTLDGQLNADFKVTGLAQILAVSGLQVGIVIGMFVALLNFCKIRKKYQFPIVLCILMFYCYLCDFRFSILRASIMFLVLLFNRIYLRRGDMLSSICAAGILTLVLFPYALWSWSFQLSYVCMLGIVFFYRPFENILKKTLIKNAPGFIKSIQLFFIKGLTFYACITITILPLIIKYYGAFPVFGMVSNLFLLPILILSFQGVVLALVTWVGQVLLYPIRYLLDFVKVTANTMAKIPFASVPISNGGYWFLFYFLGLILCSRFVFLRKQYKYSAAALLFGVYLLGFFL